LERNYSFHPSVTGNFTVELKDSIKVPQSEYDLSSDILIVSDIEGNWYSFKKLLQNGRVIDENFNWIFGKGHLVLLGDFMDRGLNVTQILWLIYKLEDDAEKQGGKVHFILGNHEVMNLVGMTYHVRSKYKKLCEKLNMDYSNYLYGDNSELGSWLRSKNTVEKIGDYLFVHGGISPEMYKKQLSINTINEKVRNYNKITEKDEFIFGNDSPLWYRGYVRDKEDNIKEYIDSILEYYRVKKIIVGHTCRSNIKYSVNNRVIDVDVHFPQDSKDEPIGQYLLITNGNFWVIDTQTNKVSLK
jgi:3',5'-cyclic AMP phosphodiesterase CpdA